MMGIANSLSNSNPLELQGADYLFPCGSKIHNNFTYYIFVGLINKIINNIVLSSSIYYFILFIISALLLVYFFCLITHNLIISLLVTVIWFTDPFFISQAGIQPVQLGLLIMPASIVLDYKLFIYLRENNYKVKLDSYKFIIFLLLIYLIRLILVGTSWYVAAIVASGSCLFFLIYFIINNDKNKKNLTSFVLFILLPWMGALLTIKLLMPNEINTFGASLDFLRGTSPDILNLFLPNSKLIIGKIFSIDTFLKSKSLIFSGDSTMWNNFLGYSLMLSSIVLVFKHEYRNKVVMACCLTGLIIFIIALGPSLKLNSTILDTQKFSYDNYLLDSNEVIFNMPWSFIYKLFPLKLMRAVYRWLLIPKFILLLGLSYFLKLLVDKKRYFLLVLIIVLAFVEFIPIQFNFNRGIKNLDEINKIDQNIVAPLKEYKFGQNDKILFWPSENDYLAPYITTRVGFKTYNGSGDKSIAIAKQHMDPIIVKLMETKDTENVLYLLNIVHNDELIDYLIVPFFSLRWNSYYWPPNNNDINKYKELAKRLEKMFTKVYKDKYFYIFALKNGDLKYDDVKYNNEIRNGLNKNLKIIEKEGVVIDEDYISFNGKTKLVLKDEIKYSNRLSIKFKIKMDEWVKDTVHIVRKWTDWGKDMSYIIGFKLNDIHIIFSDNGSNFDGIWLEPNVLNMGKWNSILVTFDKGLCKLYVNSKLIASKKLSVKKIFNSNKLIDIGWGLKGQITDIEIASELMEP